ncbi:tetraacyldisaccharide 4'-kinase [Psychrobacter pygoscelis]|uniref:tetraacyldisaccharide 4'-kinase n=1 Tax=Psychrobacter pygoscelis TaxID=2488563 RepID=UPI00103C2278|nr:tetraacyldisaccharide 4'-kinase [Psychrobacter pygoscelis]
MSLETRITRAWQQQAWWLWLLLPISVLYGLISRIRRQAYHRGWLTQYHAPVPVMIIGNITVGGSGKTPLIISLVQYLQRHGVKVGVISRGYGGNEALMPLLVTHHSQPQHVGDEPCLIVAQTGVPMAVCPNRQQAIETLLTAHSDIQFIIADDGLQHYGLARDLEWIVVDESRGFGNQQLLPTGFLREPIQRLAEATVIRHCRPHQIEAHKAALDETPIGSSGVTADSARMTMHLKADALCPLIDRPAYEHLVASSNSTTSEQNVASTAYQPQAGMTVHAISGIGYPKRFFVTLAELGLQVIEHPYPDHYAFTWQVLEQYSDHPIVMTSKDAVKFRVLAQQQIEQATEQLVADNTDTNNTYQPIEALVNLLNRLWVLPVTAELSADCYQALHTQLEYFGISV